MTYCYSNGTQIVSESNASRLLTQGIYTSYPEPKSVRICSIIIPILYSYIQIKSERLDLDEHAKDKLMRLLGDRHDKHTDVITLEADSCPIKQQNTDHVKYQLTALYYESWVIINTFFTRVAKLGMSFNMLDLISKMYLFLVKKALES